MTALHPLTGAAVALLEFVYTQFCRKLDASCHASILHQHVIIWYESVTDCLRREVREETGLEVVEATLIAVYSEPRFSFTNAFGGEQQRVAFVFLVTEWSGTLLTATDETTDARFFELDHLPDLNDFHREALKDLDTFTGEVILK